MILGSDPFITFGLLAVAAVVGYVVGTKKKERELKNGSSVSVSEVLKSELQTQPQGAGTCSPSGTNKGA